MTLSENLTLRVGEAQALEAALTAVYYVAPGQSIQAAIDRAQNAGGGIVTPVGLHAITEPLILPRSGTEPVNMVHLVGLGRGLTTIRSWDTFPVGRALIEWEDTHARAYEQRISNLSLICPYVDGTRAIHYKLNDGSTFEKVDAERLQIIMDNVYLVGSNKFQESLIRLEGYTGWSRFTNITGDPWRQDMIYDTLLFDVDYLINGAPYPIWDTVDSPGLFHSALENIQAGYFRGGMVRLFKGRMARSILRNAFCEVSQRGPCYDFYYSYGNTIETIANEGGGEQPMFRMTNSKFNTVNTGLAWCHDQGAGVGNGIELIDCSDNRFEGRNTGVGNPTMSQYGVKLVKIDAASRRNVFTNWGVIANPGQVEDEFLIEAPSSYGNRIEYVDTVSNTTGTLTGN